MEALQVLKFALKKSRLNFTAHLQLPEHSMSGDGPSPTNSLTEMLKMNPGALEEFEYFTVPHLFRAESLESRQNPGAW